MTMGFKRRTNNNKIKEVIVGTNLVISVKCTKTSLVLVASRPPASAGEQMWPLRVHGSVDAVVCASVKQLHAWGWPRSVWPLG
ncbi:hypothetical protein BRADI_4g17232v3 [Brachypodium distachyon]|uniref:Uncharacterized protein n=1 Tax=Brachypodium distachyon TaxID=15368 RepID=A0A2K2CNF2_BRADI|nr:hypothetical protein BRADI_4g17232v3 [Brachypodium distachyon]